MNWNDINMDSDYERSQDILDSYSFDALILQVECNCKTQTKQSIREQFQASLQHKIMSASSIFEKNLDNIHKFLNK